MATPWRRGRLLTAALLLLGLATCLGYAAQELRATGGTLGLPLDDSFIHLRFARSLAAGDGLAYQGGTWVSGSTGPLFTALLALGFLLPGDPILWAKSLGVVAFLGTLPVFFALLGAYRVPRPLAVVTTALLALTDWLVWSALSGMEISLFVWLSCCGLLLQARELQRGGRSCFALPVLALAALARPEGLLLLALAVLERVLAIRSVPSPAGTAEVGDRGGLALALAAALLVLAPAVLFSLVSSGAPVPTTLGAKTGGLHKLWPALRDYWRAAEVLFRPQPWAFLFAGAGLARLAALRFAAPGGRATSLLPGLWLLLLPGAYSLLAPQGQAAPLGNFGRYVFPLFPALLLLAAIGVSEPFTAIARGLAQRPRARWAAALLVVLVIAAPTVRAVLGGALRHARNVTNVEESDVAAGRYIAARLPPTATLAVQDIGAIAYLAPNPLLDLVGIVDADAARAIRESGLPGLIDLVHSRRAEYLVVFPESYGGVQQLERMLPGLQPVARFPIRQNITMAGPELVIFRLRRGDAPPSP